MKFKYLNRVFAALSSFVMVLSFLSVSIPANAAVLQDGYEDEYEAQGKTYQSLGVLEDQYDLIEPANNRFPIISPSSEYDQSYPPLFVGTYKKWKPISKNRA